MKKKVVSIALALSITLSAQTIVLGAGPSSNIIVNDKQLNIEEIHINESKMMVPLRTVSEQLNYQVKWNNNDKSIKLSRGKEEVFLKIGDFKVVVNGKVIELNETPIIKDGKTLIPIEFFDKALDLILGWDNDKKILKINNPTERQEKFFEISEDEIVSKNIDEYMKLLSQYQNFQGSLLVGRNDKIFLSKGYGLANVEQNIMNKSQTRFAIGSTTKQFTAMAIMQNYEKGFLDFNDKISKYIPQLKQGDKISIHNLLTHTSGLVDYTALEEFFNTDIKNKNPMKMVDLINNMELEFNPGETFKYSNTNYLLLGMIVEKITGLTLEDYLEENILKPLNMEDTGVIFGRENTTPDASPYIGFIDIQATDDSLVQSQAYGAGNMYSTVEDLYRWDRALKTEKLVSNDTLEKMTNIQVPFSESDGYGYGLMISETEDGKKVGHGGNTFGFTSALDRYVDKDLTIIALSNKAYANVADLSEDVKDIAIKKEYKEPEKIEEIKIEDKEIYNKYIGKYKFTDDFMNVPEITIIEKDGRLYAQATGQGAFEIFPFSETKFFAKAIDIKMEFMGEGEKASKLILKQSGIEFISERMEENEEKPLEPVEIDTEIYSELAGEYEISPEVIITITTENNKLYAQITGQERYEIFPLSEIEYFYKEVDAKIHFERDEEGNIVSLILEQNEEDLRVDKN